jgi:hypothetical protein
MAAATVRLPAAHTRRCPTTAANLIADHSIARPQRLKTRWVSHIPRALTLRLALGFRMASRGAGGSGGRSGDHRRHDVARLATGALVLGGAGTALLDVRRCTAEDARAATAWGHTDHWAVHLVRTDARLPADVAQGMEPAQGRPQGSNAGEAPAAALPPAGIIASAVASTARDAAATTASMATLLCAAVRSGGAAAASAVASTIALTGSAIALVGNASLRGSADAEGLGDLVLLERGPGQRDPFEEQLERAWAEVLGGNASGRGVPAQRSFGGPGSGSGGDGNGGGPGQPRWPAEGGGAGELTPGQSLAATLIGANAAIWMAWQVPTPGMQAYMARNFLTSAPHMFEGARGK